VLQFLKSRVQHASPDGVGGSGVGAVGLIGVTGEEGGATTGDTGVGAVGLVGTIDISPQLMNRSGHPDPSLGYGGVHALRPEVQKLLGS